MQLNHWKDKKPETVGRKKWWAMLAVGMSVFMGTIDLSIINIALPTLVAKLQTTFPKIQWVILGYALAVTGLLMGVARLGDMFRKKTIFGMGLIIFTVSSLLCGLSPSVEWLIGFRILQGIGAVTMQALGSAILVELFPARERGRAMGIIGSVVSVGVALGPALGGVIIGTIGWRWIFLVNVPVGLMTLFVLFYFVPSLPVRETNQNFDILGAFILLLVLTCFALGMTLGQDIGFGARPVRALLTVSGFGFVSFIFTEKRTNQPMIELGLFRNNLLTLSLLMGFFSFVLMGGFFLMPFYLQVAKGYAMQQVGFMMMIVPLLMGVVAPPSGWLSDHLGTRVICLSGLFLMFAGALSISFLSMETSVTGYLFRVAPMGIGMGIFFSPNNSAIMGSVPPQRLGVASGLLALSRNLGTTVWMPIMGAVFTSIALSSSPMPASINVIDAPAQAIVKGVTGAYRFAAIILLLSTILAAVSFLVEKKKRVGNSSDKISHII
jgi:EmrB/QacA subfamily drug resistance transporter